MMLKRWVDLAIVTTVGGGLLMVSACQTRKYNTDGQVRQNLTPVGLNARLLPESSDWHMKWDDTDAAWNAKWKDWLANGGIPKATGKGRIGFPALYDGTGKKISFDAEPNGEAPTVARSLWYNVPQGSYLIPAALLFALQKPDGKPFASAENLLNYGFIYPPGYSAQPSDPLPSQSSEYSFMGLPLGLVPEISQRDGVKETISIGPTCAACHTGEIYADVSASGRKTAGRTRIVIDGGQPMLEFSRFLLDLSSELNAVKNQIAQNSGEGQAFCNRAKEAEQKIFTEQRERWKGTEPFYNDPKKCRDHLAATADYLAQRLNRNGFAPRREGLVDEGPGRLDALAQLVNELTIYHLGLDPNKGEVSAVTPAAPISYPHLWTAPDMECVQTNCLTSDPLTRNLGEVSGVFGIIRVGSEHGDKDFMNEMGFPDGLSSTLARMFARLPKNKAFPPISATGSPVNMFILEDALKTLPPPQWTALFDSRQSISKIDWVNGKRIFEQEKYSVTTSNGTKEFSAQVHSCATCHVRKYEPDGEQNYAMTKNAETIWAADPAMSSDEDKAQFIRAIKIRQADVGTDPAFLKQATGHSISAEHMPVSVLLAYGALVGQTVVNGVREDASEALSAFFKKENEVTGTLKAEANGLAQDQSKPTSKLTELRTRLKNVPSLAAFGIVNTYRLNSWIRKNGVSDEDRATLSHHHASVRPLDVKVYKARPLDGIAFSSPYLHNGSIPTLEEFFKAPEARLKQFTPVSLDYDAERIGYQYPETVTSDAPRHMVNSPTGSASGPFTFKTSVEGNFNTGHTWGTELTEDEKEDLIEYLKTL